MKDLAAERAILAGLCQHGNNAYLDIADIIDVETFSETSNQVLFKCLQNVLTTHEDIEKLDFATILSSANALNFGTFLNKQQEQTYLRSLFNMPTELKTVRKMAAKSRKLQIGRMLENQLDSCKSSLYSITGDESVSHILGLVENPIFNFTSLLLNDGAVSKHIAEGIDEYFEYLINNPVENVGIPTGFSEWDKAIGGGLRAKTVNLIGARTKEGKTTHLDNVALYITYKLGIPCFNADTEMAQTDHWIKLAAILSGVDINTIETGKFGQDSVKREKVAKALDIVKSLPYTYASIAGQPFEETIAIIRKWLKQTVGFNEDGTAKPCVIFYDYLKLMSSDAMVKENLAEFQVLGFQMSALHNFMVRTSARTLGYIQLNRDGIDKETTATASGSDRVIWLCSNFSIFKSKTNEEIAEDIAAGAKSIYNKKFIPIACRHGPGMDVGDYINVRMNGNYARIAEGPTRNELHNVKKSQIFNYDQNTPF